MSMVEFEQFSTSRAFEPITKQLGGMSDEDLKTHFGVGDDPDTNRVTSNQNDLVAVKENYEEVLAAVERCDAVTVREEAAALLQADQDDFQANVKVLYDVMEFAGELGKEDNHGLGHDLFEFLLRHFGENNETSAGAIKLFEAKEAWSELVEAVQERLVAPIMEALEARLGPLLKLRLKGQLVAESGADIYTTLADLQREVEKPAA